MIKKILMLSATVVSCYATDEVDSNSTNTSGLPVAIKKVEDIIEGGPGTYPESKSVVDAAKVKSSGFWCGGCGSTSDVIDTRNAPGELKVATDEDVPVDSSLLQSEIVLDVHAGKPKVEEVLLLASIPLVDGDKPKADETVPEKGASAPADSSKFSLFNWKTWGSKSKSKTTVDASAQQSVSILDVVNNKGKDTQVIPPVGTDLQNADGKDLDTLTDIVIADDKGVNGVNLSGTLKEEDKVVA